MGISQRRSGAGEFDGHLRWQTGDDIAHLDVRIYRRLRQRWTRRFRDDAAEPLTILIEVSPAMAFGGRGKAVEQIAELLLAMAQMRHDPVRVQHLIGEGSTALDGDGPLFPPAAGDTPPWSPRPSLATIRRGSGGRVVVISSRILFLKPEEELAPLLSLGKVLWIAPLLAEELEPMFRGPVELQPAGGGTPWLGTVDSGVVGRYQRERLAAERRLESWLRLHGGERARLDAGLESAALLAPLMARAGPLEARSG